MGFCQLVDHGEQLGYPLAREGREEDHRRVVQKAQAAAEVLLGAVDGVGVLLDQVPLVHHEDHGRASLLRVACDDGVLVRGAFDGVQQQEADVGPGHGLLGLQDAELLGALEGLALAADACGVDEAVDPFVHMDDGVDGVPGGARHFADKAALIAQHPVGQGGLADVGPADQGEAPLVAQGVGLGLFGRAVEGQSRADGGDELGQTRRFKLHLFHHLRCGGYVS